MQWWDYAATAWILGLDLLAPEVLTLLSFVKRGRAYNQGHCILLQSSVFLWIFESLNQASMFKVFSAGIEHWMWHFRSATSFGDAAPDKNVQCAHLVFYFNFLSSAPAWERHFFNTPSPAEAQHPGTLIIRGKTPYIQVYIYVYIYVHINIWKWKNDVCMHWQHVLQLPWLDDCRGTSPLDMTAST